MRISRRERSASAATLSATSVQISLSLAVCLAAMLLGGIQRVQGHGQPQAGDIQVTLVLVSLMCLGAGLVFRRLDREK